MKVSIGLQWQVRKMLTFWNGTFKSLRLHAFSNVNLQHLFGKNKNSDRYKQEGYLLGKSTNYHLVVLSVTDMHKKMVIESGCNLLKIFFSCCTFILTLYICITSKLYALHKFTEISKSMRRSMRAKVRLSFSFQLKI